MYARSFIFGTSGPRPTTRQHITAPWECHGITRDWHGSGKWCASRFRAWVTWVKCQEIVLFGFLGSGSPGQPIYRRWETKLVSKGHATSCVFPRTHNRSRPYPDLSRFIHLSLPFPMHGVHDIFAYSRAPQEKNLLFSTKNPLNP